MIDINIFELIPKELREQARDTLVDFVSEHAKKLAGDNVSEKLKQLRTDGQFRRQFDKGLDHAIKRFSDEYFEKDEDLVEAIVQEKDLFKSPDIKMALMNMIKSPGSYLVEEGDLIAQSFDSVLPGRKNRQRVDQAVKFLLRCLVEELWHLPELQPVYSLQFQKITAESMKQQVDMQKVQIQSLVGVNEGVRQALLQLTDAIGERKLLVAGKELSHPKVVNNLPHPDYEQLIGREEELDRIYKILRPYPDSQSYLVSIDGIGGIGKSALALEIAYYYLHNYEQIAREERFDAIIWVSAKQNILTADGIQPRYQSLRTLNDIYTTIALTLQREEITQARASEQAEVVKKALKQQRTLLIVDNFETVSDDSVISFLRELPAPTKAVVTTRRRIDAAYPIRLVGLTQKDAGKLIQNECQKKGVELTRQDSDLLVVYTGGVPLALVWSISRLGYGMQFENLLSSLKGAKNDLTKFCFEEIVNGFQNPHSRYLLKSLGLFSKDANESALQHITKLSNQDFGDSLEETLVFGLVNKRSGRYSLLPLTKEFSLNLWLTDSPGAPAFSMQSVQQRLIDWYVKFVTRNEVEQRDRDVENTERKVKELDTEYDNFLSVTKLCEDNEDVENYARLVKSTAMYRYYKGLGRESFELCKSAKSMFERLGKVQTEDRGTILVELGGLSGYLKDPSVSEVFLEFALSCAEGAEDPDVKKYLMCRAYSIKGRLEKQKGHYFNAIQNYRKSMKWSMPDLDQQIGKETLPIPKRHYMACREVAGISLARKRTESALYWINRAIQIADEIPYWRARAQAVFLLGRIYMLKEDFNSANNAFRESLGMYLEYWGTYNNIFQVQKLDKLTDEEYVDASRFIVADRMRTAEILRYWIEVKLKTEDLLTATKMADIATDLFKGMGHQSQAKELQEFISSQNLVKP